MNWREAFLRQARSDFSNFWLLNSLDASYAHQLHYLQMTTEKLGKALLIPVSSDEAPALSHRAFVTSLQQMPGQPGRRFQLRYGGKSAMLKARVRKILPLAKMIEDLAPALAGVARPNPEYPWKDRMTKEIVCPADFGFAEFDPASADMLNLVDVLDELLK